MSRVGGRSKREAMCIHIADLFHYRAETGLSSGASGREPTCQCRRHKRCGVNPWVRKIPWRRAWQPTPVFLSGECP